MGDAINDGLGDLPEIQPHVSKKSVKRAKAAAKKAKAMSKLARDARHAQQREERIREIVREELALHAELAAIHEEN